MLASVTGATIGRYIITAMLASVTWPTIGRYIITAMFEGPPQRRVSILMDYILTV